MKNTIVSEAQYKKFGLCSKIEMPAAMQTLEANAFEDCIGLETIVLHSPLSKIEPGALKGCTALKTAFVPTERHAKKNRADCRYIAIVEYEAEWVLQFISGVQGQADVNVAILCDVKGNVQQFKNREKRQGNRRERRLGFHVVKEESQFQHQKGVYSEDSNKVRTEGQAGVGGTRQNRVPRAA